MFGASVRTGILRKRLRRGSPNPDGCIAILANIAVRAVTCHRRHYCVNEPARRVYPRACLAGSCQNFCMSDEALPGNRALGRTDGSTGSTTDHIALIKSCAVVRTSELGPIGFAKRQPWIRSKPISRAVKKSASVSTPTATVRAPN
jgi:hypothetical protein